MSHTKLPWITKPNSLGIHAYIESRIGNGMLQEVASCGPTENGETQENAEFIVKACNAHDALVDALRLVQAGLKNGGVKSKPIISFSSNSESADMKSLSEIISEALEKVKI